MDSALRKNSTRARKARPTKSGAVTARKTDATPPKGMFNSPAQGAADLNGLRTELSGVVSVVNVCVAALEAQAAHRDIDAAEALQRCVSDVLWVRIEQLDRLIARGTP